MVDAFATYAELGTLLNRTFTVPEQPWITALLESASTYLRDDVIGQQVFPATTSTFTAWPEPSGDVVLPQAPVTAVTAVTVSGVAVPFVWRDNIVQTGQTDQVSITFTFGYATAPASLKRWCMVLVSSALIPLEAKLGLTAGGLSSVAIDDFKLAWADAGASSGMSLNDAQIQLIRNQFSSGDVFVTGSRP